MNVEFSKLCLKDVFLYSLYLLYYEGINKLVRAIYLFRKCEKRAVVDGRPLQYSAAQPSVST